MRWLSRSTQREQHNKLLGKEDAVEYTMQELRHMIELLDMLAARQAAHHVVAKDALLARRRNILLILEAAETANKWRATLLETKTPQPANLTIVSQQQGA